MSAPSSLGVFNFAKANRSQANTAFPFFLWILLIASLGSLISPKVPGYCKIPQTKSSFSWSKTSSSLPTKTFKPIGSALV